MACIKTFLNTMKKKNTNRVIYKFKNNKIINKPSIPLDILNLKDYNSHKLIVLGTDKKYNSIFGAFIHNVNRGPAQGGLRYWKYNSIVDFISDGLRLSEGMSRKSALSGLWYGGGKGIIGYNDLEYPNNTIARRDLFQEYGKFISSLNGIYYTAEDVGTVTDDMDNVFKNTRFVTCIGKEKGGSGNPSYYTAKGVVSSLSSITDLNEKKILVQGLGNVSQPMINMLFTKGVAKVYISEINNDKIQLFLEDCKWSNKINIINNPDDIYNIDADIFIPNALGGILNKNTIPKLKVGIICGAANNQLMDNSCAQDLYKRNIIYIPDFVINRMGIVNCANENYGRLDNDPDINKHYAYAYQYSLPNTIKNIKNIQNEKKINLHEAANILSDEYILHKHPIFPDRANNIIDTL